MASLYHPTVGTSRHLSWLVSSCLPPPPPIYTSSFQGSAPEFLKGVANRRGSRRCGGGVSTQEAGTGGEGQ